MIDFLLNHKKITNITALLTAFAIVGSALGLVQMSSVTASSHDTIQGIDYEEVRQCMSGVRTTSEGQFAHDDDRRGSLGISAEGAQLGSSGEGVEFLHGVLNCDPRTELDGPIETTRIDKDQTTVVFNETTQDALQRFQELYGLDGDGSIVTPETAEILSGLTSTSIITQYQTLFQSFMYSFAGGSGLPFGGQVYNVTYCTCSGGAVVDVGPPRGGRFLYYPGVTTVYEYGQIPRTGVWLLGNYVPGAICLRYSGTSCSFVPAQGIITIVGTSR